MDILLTPPPHRPNVGERPAGVSGGDHATAGGRGHRLRATLQPVGSRFPDCSAAGKR